VKLCFEKIELSENIKLIDDNESDDLDEKMEVDKIIQSHKSIIFQSFFAPQNSSFSSKYAHRPYKQVIFSIICPPPEV
jgi:hypothetical protein